MRWAVFENTKHRTRAAHLFFEDANDNYPILVNIAGLFPEPEKPSAFPCVVSREGVCRHFTEGFKGFDSESIFLGFEDVEPVDASKGISSFSDVLYPLSFASRHPKNVREISCGWLSPEGDTYSCVPGAHWKLASELIDEFGFRNEYEEEKRKYAGTNEFRWLLEQGWAMIRPNRKMYEVVFVTYADELPVLFTTKVREGQIAKIQELGLWTSAVEKRAHLFKGPMPPF